jgi:hypothetical protein
MRTIHITISPESRFLRAFLISAVLLIALVWRILRQGDRLFSAKVLLASVFTALACLGVWGVQRATGQRWSFPWMAIGRFLRLLATRPLERKRSRGSLQN